MTNYLDVIIDNLQNEKCVILLGPELLVTKDGVTLQQDLFRYFASETNLKIVEDIDHFVIFKNKTSKTFFYTDYKKYYDKNAQITDLHKHIARIPFHLIISISPDLILKSAFDHLGIEVDFQFYNKKTNPKEIKKPGLNKPLLYNLFGSIAEEDSLIVTHDDLFEFIFSILGGDQRLPRELKVSLQTAKVFLFLGFDFEKWYVKLILRLFDLHKNHLPLTSETKGGLDEKIKNFYINNFEMEFIPYKTEDLIKELYTECEKQHILREVKQLIENPITAKVKDLLKEDDIEQALETLEEYLENRDDELYNMVIQTSGSFHGLKRKMVKGTLTRDEMDSQTAKIREALIAIADELKRL